MFFPSGETLNARAATAFGGETLTCKGLLPLVFPSGETLNARAAAAFGGETLTCKGLLPVVFPSGETLNARAATAFGGETLTCKGLLPLVFPSGETLNARAATAVGGETLTCKGLLPLLFPSGETLNARAATASGGETLTCKGLLPLVFSLRRDAQCTGCYRRWRRDANMQRAAAACFLPMAIPLNARAATAVGGETLTCKGLLPLVFSLRRDAQCTGCYRLRRRDANMQRAATAYFLPTARRSMHGLLPPLAARR